MTVPKHQRQIVFEMLEASLQQHVIDGEIDKDALVRSVDDQFRLRQPNLSDAFTVEARRSTLYDLTNEFMRKSKHPVLVASRSKEEDRLSARSTRRIVQIRQADGQYIAKPFSECTKSDVAQLIHQYTAAMKGAARRIQFLKDVYYQMDMASVLDVRVSDVTTVQEVPDVDIADVA